MKNKIKTELTPKDKLGLKIKRYIGNKSNAECDNESTVVFDVGNKLAYGMDIHDLVIRNVDFKFIFD